MIEIQVCSAVCCTGGVGLRLPGAADAAYFLWLPSRSLLLGSSLEQLLILVWKKGNNPKPGVYQSIKRHLFSPQNDRYTDWYVTQISLGTHAGFSVILKNGTSLFPPLREKYFAGAGRKSRTLLVVSTYRWSFLNSTQHSHLRKHHVVFIPAIVFYIDLCPFCIS